MSRIAYVDGRFVPHNAAAIHIEDRSVQFADAVYEVWGVKDGALLDSDGHFTRLERSLGELKIAMPVGREALAEALFELIRRNRLRNGLVYLQVSRGKARRDHAFPGPDVKPCVIATAKRVDFAALVKKAETGIAVKTMPDQRWARCDIKTVSLLANVLAKQAAKETGAQEAWLTDRDGFVTEGSSSNAWIVTPEGALVTRPASNAILNGITRRTLISVAQGRGLTFEERPFTVDEALAAREAFITNASSMLMPVVTIDGQPVGNGHPGSLTTELRTAYQDSAVAAAHKKTARAASRPVARRAKRRISSGQPTARTVEQRRERDPPCPMTRNRTFRTFFSTRSASPRRR
ncbi:D-amino-acid transaminase [Hyphobacterium marinum]|uniref:Probable branched-chain-amino-acid aminotransferase n=1 Tax=Hyphobacterium marinum TaxID=3116574 RepID=A0ABU7LZH8_9PROT|nr:D-amino-acid transaminase [Hyphobacterium sp. Y6023]MEE2566590.1 D-amino-acid transaminase [Hyphobacterium sp. Y6023]